MQFLLIIAGLILLLAFPHAFAAAVTVGWILVIAGTVLIVVPLLVFRAAAKRVGRHRKKFDLNDFRF